MEQQTEQKMEWAKRNGTTTKSQNLSMVMHKEENEKIEIASKIKQNVPYAQNVKEHGIGNGTIARIRGTSVEWNYEPKFTLKRLGRFNKNTMDMYSIYLLQFT